MTEREKLIQELKRGDFESPNIIRWDLIADFIIEDRKRIVNLIKNKVYNDKCRCKSCVSITKQLEELGVTK